MRYLPRAQDNLVFVGDSCGGAEEPSSLPPLISVSPFSMQGLACVLPALVSKQILWGWIRENNMSFREMAVGLSLLQIMLTGAQSLVVGCKEDFSSRRRSKAGTLEERNLHLMNTK